MNMLTFYHFLFGISNTSIFHLQAFFHIRSLLIFDFLFILAILYSKTHILIVGFQVFFPIHSIISLEILFALSYLDYQLFSTDRLIYDLKFKFHYLFFKYWIDISPNHFEILFSLFKGLVKISFLFSLFIVKEFWFGLPSDQWPTGDFIQVHSSILFWAYHDQNSTSSCQTLPFLFISFQSIV